MRRLTRSQRFQVGMSMMRGSDRNWRRYARVSRVRGALEEPVLIRSTPIFSAGASGVVSAAFCASACAVMSVCFLRSPD